MKKAIVILIWIICLVSMCVFVCACINHERYPEEEAEAEQILSYISDNHCLENLSLCDTIAVDGKIELSYWGDCDLEDAFDVSETINNYLDTHPESIIHKKQMELIVKIYPFEPDKLDYERQNYYAKVTKSSEKGHLDSLKINTPDTIQLSEFKNCQVPYKKIETSYNVVFDNYEAILSVEGLESFVFSDGHIASSKENLIRVLESLCYYEDNDVQIPFKFYFSLRYELRATYDEFVSTHPQYKIFPR